MDNTRDDAPKMSERIWLRVTDKTVMATKPSDADELDVEYIRADRAAPTDNTALVEALQNMMTFARSKMDDPTRADDMRIFKDAHAALASLEASAGVTNCPVTALR